MIKLSKKACHCVSKYRRKQMTRRERWLGIGQAADEGLSKKQLFIKRGSFLSTLLLFSLDHVIHQPGMMINYFIFKAVFWFNQKSHQNTKFRGQKQLYQVKKQLFNKEDPFSLFTSLLSWPFCSSTTNDDFLKVSFFSPHL